VIIVRAKGGNMSFGEKLKKGVRQRAAYRCCRCQKVGIQVHHIIPQERGGEDTFENAAPLCAGCHDDFGGNPEKRKGITEMRDWWYEQVESHFFGPNPSSEKLEQINAKLQDIQANQADVTELKDLLRSVSDELINSITPGTAPAAASSIVNSSSVASSVELGPGVRTNFVCRRCNTMIGLLVGSDICPQCGEPIDS
jgi:hypothetical protein